MLAWHLGLRYLRKRRAAWLALAAITLTVWAPVTVIGVTQGFLDILKKQARASESDVTVQQLWGGGGIPQTPHRVQTLLGIDGVAAAAPFVQLYALMTPKFAGASESSLGVPCQVDGVDWAADATLHRLEPKLLHPLPDVNLSAPAIKPDKRGSGFLTQRWREELCLIGLAAAAPLGLAPAPPPPRLRPPPGVVAGRELLYGCGLYPGQPIDLVGAAQTKQQAEISDTIGTGILEVDKLELLAPLGLGQSLAGFGATRERPARVDGWRLAAKPGVDLDRLAAAVEDQTGVRAETWMRRRWNMVKSLEYQRNIMGLVMLAIQAIAVFVVYAVFSTMVAEKRHDIGVLLGIGARRLQIAGAFLLAAIAACLFGGLLGWALGWGTLVGANILSTKYGVLLFPQDVFYSPDTPISWDPRIPLVFIGAMSVIGLIAAALPAWRAARIEPVDILREGG
jgi:ABC-type lipoprotein release transport system permease subunit